MNKLKWLASFVGLMLLITLYKKSPPSKPSILSPSPSDNLSVCQHQLDNKKIPVQSPEQLAKVVNFNSLPDAKTYKTVINDAFSKGPNFSGHFTIASWGCGTDCVGYAVIDNNSGNIIDYAPVNGDYHLGEYSTNSRYFFLQPVYKGEQVKYFEIIETQGQKPVLQLSCTEPAMKDMYGIPEELKQ